jgi:hypothetical protein
MTITSPDKNYKHVVNTVGELIFMFFYTTEQNCGGVFKWYDMQQYSLLLKNVSK